MTREQVLNCLNTHNFTIEFITDWATRRADGHLTDEQLSWVISQVIAQLRMGILNATIFQEMIDHYAINELRDVNSQHIMWL